MSTDFDNLLRDGMERFTADLRAPVNLAGRARRSRQQRLTLRTTASGLAAAAVAAIAFALVPSTAPVTTGVDLQRTERFDVEYLNLTETGRGAIQLWIYGNQMRELVSSPSGRRVEDQASTIAKARNGENLTFRTIVDYQNKTWGHGRKTIALAVARLACHLGNLIAYPTSPSALPAWIAGIRKLIKCGTVKVAGTEQLNGIPTIKLKVNLAQLAPGEHETIWVKRSDFVPVRLAWGSKSTSAQADVSWLPPTKANRALLRVLVPSGFRRVPLSQILSSSTSSGSCHVSSSHPHKQICTSSR